MLVRGLGFDIKKFDFKSDLQELNITASDSEEVELTVGLDSNAIKRKGRRSLRELKYYYIENKYMLNIVLIVFLVIGAFSIFINKEVVNKVYDEGETMNTSIYNLTVTDSYTTSLSEWVSFCNSKIKDGY